LTFKGAHIMWENETVVLVVSFKKRILAGKDKVRFGRISTDNAIPPFIKILFQKRVEKYLVTESPFSVQPTPHFDLHPEDLENLKGRFLEVLREVASFREDEVETILREALVLRLDYLIKPVDTMRKILFDDQPSISIRGIEEKLEPFSKLLPYAEQLIAECRRLGYKSIEQDEYGSVMSDVTQKITKENPMKVVLHDFSVTTDFLSETKGEEIGRVEGQILQEFLADRNLWSFRRALDVEMKLGKEDFDTAELEMTLKRYLELKEAFLKNGTPPKMESKESFIFKEVKKPEIEIEAVEPVIEQEPETFESISLIDEKTITPEPKSIPKEESWDIDEVMDRQPPVLDLEEVKEKPVKSDDNLKTSKSMRIIRREQKEDEGFEDDVIPMEKDILMEKPALPQKRVGLKNLIDEKAEKVFIKKLFDGDASSYEKLLDKLDEAESWRVAKILIDNELFKRDVDPFSREAIKLVDLIYSRYYPEEGIGGGKS
jgi:hypothetical protein